MQKVATVLAQALRFGCAGIINTAVGFAGILIARRIPGFGEYSANLAGFLTGLLIGFWINRTWTFRSQVAIGPSIGRYAAAFATAYSTNILILATCLNFTSLSRIHSQLLAIGAYSIAFFVLCRYFVFATTESSERAKNLM